MAVNDVFCLRLQDFDTNIRDSWKEIQSQKDFCDVTLACDDKQMAAHKFIISSSSPVFRNILKQNSNQHPFIYLRGVKYKDLSNLLNFIYQGEVNIPQEELNSFLAVAEDLKVRGLSGDEAGKSLNEKQQSPLKDIFGEENYDPPPKRKFTRKLDDNEIYKSFGTDPKNAKVEMNVGHNIVTETSQVDMDSWDESDIKEQLDSVSFPVSTFKNNMNDAGLYSCDNCGKQFRTSYTLKLHVESIHDGIRYSCNQCDYEATTKGHLRTHTKSVHEKITYPCLQCDYQATQTSNLKTHVRKSHN